MIVQNLNIWTARIRKEKIKTIEEKKTNQGIFIQNK